MSLRPAWAAEHLSPKKGLIKGWGCSPVAECSHPMDQVPDSSHSSIETKPTQMGKEEELESNGLSLPWQQCREVSC